VAADETGHGPTGSTTGLRLRWLAIVVAVMALLTAGWPLLNSAVADRQPLAAGSHLTVGSGSASSGVVTVGSGWYMLPAQSNPTEVYVLRKDGLVLAIRHVSLVDRGQAPGVWRGLRQILAVTNPGVGLGKPAAIRTARRLRAITGLVSGRQLVGTATIFPGPSNDFAIEMVVLGPRATSPALRAAALRIISSLTFGVQG